MIDEIESCGIYNAAKRDFEKRTKEFEEAKKKLEKERLFLEELNGRLLHHLLKCGKKHN